MRDGTTHGDPADPDLGLADALLREAGWVRALARRLARDQSAADDAAQAAMALALERRPEPGSSLRPWLARVVARLTRRRSREELRRRDRERRSASAGGASESGDEILERFELQQELAERVRALPEPYRGVVLRRFYEGRSVAEIARETGASAATVRSQIARAVERLRRDFAHDRGNDSFHSGGVLALLLLAAGPRGGLLSARGIELMAMKTTTKIGLAALLVAATFVATRGFLDSTADAERSAANETVLAQPGAIPEDDEALADVEAEGTRDDLAAVAEAHDATGGSEPTEAAADVAPVVSVVRARLVDERGAPLVGAELRSIFGDGRPRGADCFDESDADGLVAIEIEDPFMRAYKTEVFAMAFRATAPMRETVFLLSTPRWHGETDLGDIALAPGGAIRGTLTDASGRPIEDGIVYVCDPVAVEDEAGLRLTGPPGGERRPRADSDANGVFEFPGVAAGSCRLFAGAEGRLWTITDSLDVALGGTKDVGRIVLEPIPPEELIAGVVLRPDGSPAPRAKVGYENRGDRSEGSITADDAGRFTYSPGGPSPVEFVARDANRAFGMSAPRTASRGEDELVLELTPKREIVLTIVDEDGEPVSAASVMPFLTDRNYFADGGRPIPGEDWSQSDATGVVHLPVPPQEFRFTVSRNGYEASRHGPFTPDDAPDAMEVVLVREPRIEGRVTAYGEPVQGAVIKVAQRLENFVPLEAGFPMRFFLGQVDRIETDADGRFVCPVESDWTDVSVLAFSDRYATGETELTLEAGAGATDVVVEMTDGGSVTGTVTPPVGVDVGDLYVAASRGDGHPVWTRVSADGTYLLENLAPGDWRVEGRLEEPVAEVLSVANDPEDKEFRWNALVTDRETTTLDVDMRGRGRVALHGTFRVDGGPASGWRVQAERDEDRYTGRDIPTAELDESGSFVLDVPAGTCKLTLIGEIEGGARVEVVRQFELEGTRVDWSDELVTGAVDETLDEAVEELRLCRGNSYGGDHEITQLVPKGGTRVVGRAPVGTNWIQTQADTNFGMMWTTIRTVEVRED